MTEKLAELFEEHAAEECAAGRGVRRVNYIRELSARRRAPSAGARAIR